MILRTTIASIWRRIFAPPYSSEPRRLRVINRTRHTEVACEAQLADSGSSRRKGLLGRDGLAEGEGLWIVPCEAVHTFGMRFVIDVVYLDRHLRILKTRANMQRGKISACLRSRSVLELPAGTLEKTQTQRGDVLEITIF